MLEHGASLKALQEILGHADAALTLNTYAHIVGSAAHDEIQKIDSLFNLTEKSETEKPKHRQVFQPHNTRKKGARTSDIIGR